MHETWRLDNITKQELDQLPSISAKIRHLCDKGYTRADTARILGKRYQHVKNVMDSTSTRKKQANRYTNQEIVKKPEKDIPTNHISEDEVKQILANWLEHHGWFVDTAWGQTRGLDCIASKANDRWVVEVKGCGSRQPMRVNYFLAVLGEVLQRMDDPRSYYSIAMPDLNQFRGLWYRLPDLAKKRTRLSAIFVGGDGRVHVEN